jgi:hypothetical protein
MLQVTNPDVMRLQTFEIMDAHTCVISISRFCLAKTKFYCSWITDVNSFPSLDSQTQFGPTFEYEYNTRETYGGSISSWGPNDPLNATWWHHVTEGRMAVPQKIKD